MNKVESLDCVPSIAKYLKRIGAEPRSLRTAVVKLVSGDYWHDIATIKFSSDGTVKAPTQYMPTASESGAIKEDFLKYSWPKAKPVGENYALPNELKNVKRETIYEFRDTNGQIVMLQQRLQKKGGDGKVYIPWTFFDDGIWRRAEPDGLLPLWGMECIKGNTTAFIHEGAKAARAVRDLLTDKSEKGLKAFSAHPWKEELQHAAHLGWVGGALNPSRTDWAALVRNGVKRAYIVADNDTPGKSAIPKIAFYLKGITVYSIEFDDTFPPSFDMADEWPKSHFVKHSDGEKIYIGPSFRSLLQPATWATDMVKAASGNEKEKETPVIREEFREMWTWVEEVDVYACKEFPEIRRQAPIFNGMMASFSHVNNIASLLRKTYQGRVSNFTYRPDVDRRIINNGRATALNLHTPSLIKSKDGDYSPWLEFLNYLFPIAEDRKQVERWCATLLARPEIKIGYALLLVSKTQGMGKSTLGERILAPIVGHHNTGFPSERMIVESNFNSWVAHKRLVVVGEIYTGQSYKAYNNLKGYVTDVNLDVNEKFERSYTIENWAHILACSNSEKALRMEDSDRRWFVPTLSNNPWPHSKFETFNNWLLAGGLGIIKHWAGEYGDYVKIGEHSPTSSAKQSMINESRSDAIKYLNSWCEAALEEDDGFIVSDACMRRLLQENVRGTIYESNLEIRKAMVAVGFHIADIRARINGLMVNLILSPKCFIDFNNEAKEMSKKEQTKWLRSKVIDPFETLLQI